MTKVLSYCPSLGLFNLLLIVAAIWSSSTGGGNGFPILNLKINDSCDTNPQCFRSVYNSFCYLSHTDDENPRCHCNKGYFASEDRMTCTPYRLCSSSILPDTCAENEFCKKGEEVCLCKAHFKRNRSTGICVIFKSGKTNTSATITSLSTPGSTEDWLFYVFIFLGVFILFGSLGFIFVAFKFNLCPKKVIVEDQEFTRKDLNYIQLPQEDQFLSNSLYAEPTSTF